MNVKANFFYNYHTVGDVLMAIVQNDKTSTHFKSIGNVTLIFNNEDLIGINFFKISEICKIKSKGKIVLPPNALIDMLNSLLLPICDYQLEYVTESMFVVGHVLTCEEHPSSDHLHVLTVDIGSEILDIVCGAYNVKEDVYCVVAKVGAMMMNGQIIKPGKLLGEVSNGMCCSPKELGMDIDYPAHHILLLDKNEVKIGQDFFLTKGGF